MHFVQRVLWSRLTLHLQIFYGFTHVASIYANLLEQKKAFA